MDSTYKDLQKIGFTENEARVYVALLEKPDSTGYEASRVSGVPRAKVYEVLASMERKGLLMVTSKEDRQLYRVIPPEVLLENQKREMGEVIYNLETNLKKMEKKDQEEPMVSLQGREKVLEMARTMVKKSGVRIFACGWPEELQMLEKDFISASQSGTREYILSFGEVDFPNLNVFQHPISPMLLLRVITTGRWLTLVTDNREVLIAQIQDKQKTRALWTKNPAVVQTAGGWVTNDISFHFVMQKIQEIIQDKPKDPGERLKELREEARGLWRGMWSLEENETEAFEETETDFDLGELWEKMERRNSGKSFNQSGIVQINLKGKEQKTWQLIIKPFGLEVVEGGREKPDLLLEMFPKDLQGIIEGDLPFNALLPRIRVMIEGDFELARVLPEIFG